MGLRIDLPLRTAGEVHYLCEALDILAGFARGSGGTAAIRKRLAALDSREVYRLWRAAGEVVEALRTPLRAAQGVLGPPGHDGGAPVA
jgi:hypothetical protein